VKKLFKGVKKIFKKPLKALLPIGAVALPFLAPKIPVLGGLLSKAGSLFKFPVLGGSAGSIAGALGGSAVLSYLLSGGRMHDQVDFSSYTPPYAQQGADVITSLLQATPYLASEMVELKRPYIDQAIRSAEEMEGRVAGLYDNLLTQTDEVVNREMTKQATKLGALGLANTQAMQWTTADILGKMKLPIMEEKTRLLSDIAMSKPKLYSEIADLALQKSGNVLAYEMSKDLARILFGVPSIVQPQVKPGMGRYFPSIANILLTSTLLRRQVI